MKREIFHIAAIAAAVIALAGCGQAPAPAPSTTVSQNDTQQGGQRVSEEMKKAAQQYAEGLHVEHPVAIEIHEYYESHSKLPDGKRVLRPADAANPDVVATIRSIAVGPVPGVITITWGGTAVGLLAGKSLVLEPMELKRDPFLCWKVGSSTTVPQAITQLNGIHFTIPCH